MDEIKLMTDAVMELAKGMPRYAFADEELKNDVVDALSAYSIKMIESGEEVWRKDWWEYLALACRATCYERDWEYGERLMQRALASLVTAHHVDRAEGIEDGLFALARGLIYLFKIGSNIRKNDDWQQAVKQGLDALEEFLEEDKAWEGPRALLAGIRWLKQKAW